MMLAQTSKNLFIPCDLASCDLLPLTAKEVFSMDSVISIAPIHQEINVWKKQKSLKNH